MSAPAAASAVNGAGNSSVRHSARQTRTNPSRVSKTVGRSSFSSHGFLPGAAARNDPQTQPQSNTVPHGFYPAITHFTDAIDALPREFRRHTSLLREVDGKAWLLEKSLSSLLTDAAAVILTQREKGMEQGTVEQPFDATDASSRRQLFYNLRANLSELMVTADEKNHVLRNANSDLRKQLYRLDSIYPHVEGEISEEARLGSLTHWAYSTKMIAPAGKTGGAGNTGSERTRREVAAAAATAAGLAAGATAPDPEQAARREGMVSRKNRRKEADVDGEDVRAGGGPTRKATGAGKTRGGGDTVTSEQITSSVSTGGAPTTTSVKRRRIEKPQGLQPLSAAMERSASSAAAAAVAGRRAGSKEAGSQEPVVKKRGRAPNPTSTTARKRANTGASNNSPSNPLPSPRISTVKTVPPTVANGATPPPTTTPRPQQPLKPQPALTQQALASRQGRPLSSASNRGPSQEKLQSVVETKAVETDKDVVGVGPTSEPIDRDIGATGGDEAKQSPNLVTPKAVEPDAHDDNGADAPPNVAATLDGTASNNKAMKLEVVQAVQLEPPAVAMSSRDRRSASSKTSTPVVSTFAESQLQTRTRPVRTVEGAAGGGPGGGPTKRSHKKSASVSTIQQRTLAAAARAEDEDSSRHGDDEDDEGEPRYCYCNQVSFGEMVACDMENCPREWFHLSCVGLTKPPLKSAKWYCNECKENLKKGKVGNGK